MSGNEIFSQIARRILMQELGVERASDQMALATVTVHKKFLVQLSVLLGHEGASALFRQSLRRTQSAFPFYAEVIAGEPRTALDVLGKCLEKQTPERIVEASIALLTSFLELLATFIGERLTIKLLHDVWSDLGPVLPQETAQ